MTGAAAPTADARVPGRTVLTPRALERLATALSRDAARVPFRDVRVTLSDAEGALRAGVTLPLALSELPGPTVTERGAELRDAVITGMRDLAGRRVATVDVRFAGVHRGRPRRVA